MTRLVLPSPNGSALASALADCGRELADRGFESDVAAAADLDVSTSVPLLADGRFIDAASQPAPHHGARRSGG